MTRQWLVARTALAILSGAIFAQISDAARADDLPPIGCEATDKIDGSTAADARIKMEAAGYQKVTELKKSCSNYWYGVAVKDGTTTHVSLSPQGVVRSEAD